MDRPSNQLLARAAFPLDQHGRLGVGHLFDQLEDLLHRLALPEDVVQPIATYKVFFERVQLGDVAQQDKASSGPSLRIAEDVGAKHEDLVASSTRAGLEFDVVDRLIVADRLADRGGRAAELLAQKRGAVGVDRFLLSHFEDFAGRPIDAHDAAPVVDRHESFDEAVEDRLQVLSANAARTAWATVCGHGTCPGITE